MTKFWKYVWMLVKAGVSFTLALALAVLAFGDSAMAQLTNTPAGVSSTITSGVGGAYDVAVGIGVSIMAIGAVIWAVRKGLKARM